MKINIAIDGTSGVGKSTVAKLIAKKMNLTHLDTGAMYRCIAYYLGENATNIDEKLKHFHLVMKDNQFIVNGEDVTSVIRNDRISLLASDYAKLKNIREFLVKKQQEIAKNKGFILDGRDIGSVVLKDAEVKFYLEANPNIRAERRVKEYLEKGESCDFETVYQKIIQRDLQDQNREESPLVKVADAYVIDTSNKTIDEVVAVALAYIESKVNV